MKITVFGAGYVGLVTAVCFAKLGHDVLCMDIDQEKIAQLKQGTPTLYERDLEPLLALMLENGRLDFTHQLKLAVAHGDFLVIAVGTPTDSEGQPNLSFVYKVTQAIAHYLQHDAVIIIKSTVPPGTADKISDYLRHTLHNRQAAIDAEVVSNPEFLQEGNAIHQFLHPDRVIVGSSSILAIQRVYDLYRPVLQTKDQFVLMSKASAELTKYTANAFLATKISFMNEISQIAEKTGADIESIKQGLGLDYRINPLFLNAGCGFGGSCFPKDLTALITTAEAADLKPVLLKAVMERNANAQRLLFYHVSEFFKHELKGKTIALWGLTFKPETDDVRFATSHILAEMFWNAGAQVSAYDPMGMENFAKHHSNQKRLTLAASALEALNGADVLVIATEWAHFKQIPLQEIKSRLRHAAIFDGRHLWPLEFVKKHALHYYAIGRPLLTVEVPVQA